MLVAIKLVHTVVWAAFVAVILAVPVFALMGRFDFVLGCTAVIALEGLTLAINKGACPLTGIAARYTPNREPNFDIYLPMWLARNNKLIFGSLFVAGALFAAGRWLWS